MAKICTIDECDQPQKHKVSLFVELEDDVEEMVIGVCEKHASLFYRGILNHYSSVKGKD